MSASSPEFAARGWAAWGSPQTLALSRVLVLAAGALLFLNAAATIQLVYTLRISYLLCALASVVAFPWVLAGWRRMPAGLRAAALLLAAVYLVSAIVGNGEALNGVSRGGHKRTLVYLADLSVGAGTLGLVCGAFPDAVRQRWLVLALAAGAAIAAGYGIVQWPARHYGWGIADINNALNPDAVSRGEVMQGTGLLLGWERVRGTFTEPLFFGLYLAAMLPLAVAAMTQLRGRVRQASAVGALLVLGALFLTSSFPSWAIAALALLVLGLAMAILRGAELRSAGASALLAVALMGTIAVFTGGPALFSTVTGRSRADYDTTIGSRTHAWRESVDTWARAPIRGHGPGQSAVQLSYRQTIGSAPGAVGPLVLGSAQGILTASLIDAGVLGPLAWLAFFTTLGSVLARALLRRPTPVRALLIASGLAVTFGALVSGDRLELQTWLVLGLALSSALSVPEGDPT